jgi:hypothetical protein
MLGLLCLRHFQQYFSYIVVVSFIDEITVTGNIDVVGDDT